MRPLPALILSITLLLAAGCSGSPTAIPVEPGGGPAINPATVAPAPNGINPVQRGRELLESGGRRWLDGPVPVVVQQMTYAEAHKWVPMLSQEGDQFWGAQTSVWLVVLKGAWIPTDSGQANPEPVTKPGCLLVLFRAADGELIAAGDSLCPGES